MTELLILAWVFVAAADGDPMTLRDGSERVEVRLAVSRRNLHALCQNARQIEIEPVDTDRYGRTVAHVHCDGEHVNWRQVEEGFAWCFTRYLKHPETCLPLEKAARDAKRGLWREPSPQPPWEFRAAKRVAQ